MKRLNTAMTVLGMLAVLGCLTATPSGGDSEGSEFKKRVEALLKAEDYERALRLLNQFIDERPEKPIGRVLLVKTLAASGSTNKAFEEYERLYNFSGKLSKELLLEILHSVFTDDKYEVWEQAAIVLGIFKDKRAVEPLMNALKDDNSYVRAEAAIALGRLKAERAVKLLMNARADEDRYVQKAAYMALELMGHEMPLILDMEVLEAMRRGIETAEKIEKFEEDFEKDKYATTSILIDKLRNNDSKERADAAQMLGRFWKQEDLKDKRVVPALIDVLSDDNSEVQEQVSDALVELVNKPDIPVLVKVLGDSELDIRTKVYAATALVKLSEG